jgi:RND family efflux transporter MFP subunit
VLEASLRGAKAKLESKGKINAARATLENRMNHLKQMQDLFEKQHASDKEVKQAQLDADLAKSNLQTANDEMRQHEMEVEQIKAQIERRIIRAPRDGVVLELPKKAGESVTSSDNHVATVVNLQQLKVRYFLSTKQALAIRPGEQLQLYFPETRQTAEGTVSFVSPVTDSNSGTVRVEFKIDNSGGEFRSGLRCVLIDKKISELANVRTGQKK